MKSSLRLPETQARYVADRAHGELSPLGLMPRLQEFEHWAIVENKYPYDASFCVHHLLIPKRWRTERSELTVYERAELEELLDSYIDRNYDCVIENTHRARTVVDYYHLHLLVYKEV